MLTEANHYGRTYSEFVILLIRWTRNGGLYGVQR